MRAHGCMWVRGIMGVHGGDFVAAQPRGARTAAAHPVGQAFLEAPASKGPFHA